MNIQSILVRNIKTVSKSNKKGQILSKKDTFYLLFLKFGFSDTVLGKYYTCFPVSPTLTDVLTHDITFGNMATEIRHREPLFHHRNTTTVARRRHSEKNICLYLSLPKIFPAILPLYSQNKMVNILRTSKSTSLNTILSRFPTKELINSPNESFS